MIVGLFLSPVVSAEEPDPLPALIQRIKPGVVAVGTYHFNDKPSVGFSGTGFAVTDGTRVITNAHVIESIRNRDRLYHLRIFHAALPPKGIRAEVVAEDPFHDLSLLKIEGHRLKALELGRTADVREGHRILFTGYPIGFVLGRHPTTHQGFISAIAPIVLPSPTARIMDSTLLKHLESPYEIFQLDATAYPGNSGSPVYMGPHGQVVGVVNMVFVKDKKEHALKDPTGITYAIPVRHVHELIQQEGG